MKPHRDKALTALALLGLAVGAVGCMAAEESSPSWSLAEERAELQRTFGPGVEIEEGEALQAALDHNERFMALEQTISSALQRAVGVDPTGPALWELHPGILYSRMVLTQAVLNGEVACEEHRQCELVKAGLLPATDDNAAPCRWTQSCDRQHIDTLSTCNAILAMRCRFPVGALCRKYRQAAYNLCRDVADCQLACCTSSCSGANCAARTANGKIGEQCADGVASSPLLPPGEGPATPSP